MATKPHYLAYALALGVGAPLLGLSLRPLTPAAPNPQVDGRVLHDLAFGGKGVETAPVVSAQDKPSESHDDAQVGSASTAHAALGELDPLRDDRANRPELDPLAPLNLDFLTKPGLPSRPQMPSSQDNGIWASSGGTASGGDDSGFLAPPPIFGAQGLGGIGGGGGGAGGAASGPAVGEQSGEQYIIVGSWPWGYLGGSGGLGSGGSGTGGGNGGSGGIGGTGGDGGDGGGGILHVGGGDAVPEPASWLLGFCAVGVLVALRAIARRT